MKLYEVIGTHPYGYWILGTGQLVRIEERMGHMKYAREVLGIKARKEDAFDEGWIRIVHAQPESMFIENIEDATPEARKMLWKLLTHHKAELTTVIGEYEGFEGNPPKPANQFAEYVKTFG